METALIKKTRVMTLANKITILRILLIPFIVIGLLKGHPIRILPLIGFSMLTDFIDGVVARKRGERTKLGAFLDPMADKLFLSALFITLVFLGKMEVWVFVMAFSRDLLIVLGWLIIFILTGSSEIEPRILGKIATAVQMTSAILFLFDITDPARSVLLWSMVITTAASTIDYLFIAEKKLGGF
ncbi:MAG: CDP-alcohol phosphatidyltransferase family protein [Elusimicrobiota bacterium]